MNDDCGKKFSRDILGYCFRLRTMVTGKENLKLPTGEIQIIGKETKQLQVYDFLNQSSWKKKVSNISMKLLKQLQAIYEVYWPF
jgi:hypothetical protein